MDKRYLDLMEKALSAYTDEHILHYFNETKKSGLTEHGFPRLTANIGILVANGRRGDLLAIFQEMMEFCCKTIPTVKAANDFSVREMICCLEELEKHNVTPLADRSRWKGYLATIQPEQCYNVFAKLATDTPNNWALYTGVGEYFRQHMGLCQCEDFIDIQIASQLQRFDENGMYKDNDEGSYHQPIVYDLVARVLFSLLLFAGYRGKYFQEIDGLLRKAGLVTLHMQSAAGEIAFGGRSNQFIFNEGLLAAIFEYEAARYQKEGAFALAGAFKAAALQAVKAAECWLGKMPISHVKNRYDSAWKFGCEGYAYFDKYMITAASFFYAAGLFCNPSITPKEAETPMVWRTSKHFHKTFVKADGYSLQLDTNADAHYDANGLGRVHKVGAPSAICLSMPFAKTPNYETNGQENPVSFSICPAVRLDDEKWLFGAEKDVGYSPLDCQNHEAGTHVRYLCDFCNQATAFFDCCIDKEGVLLQVKEDLGREIGICLPIFSFDGAVHTDIVEKDNKIVVTYDGWVCEYEGGAMRYLNLDVANRNGIYKCYMAHGKKLVQVKIKIYKAGE